MDLFSSQPSLFGPGQGADPAQAASARERMRNMIDRLSVASVPPWKDQMAVILDEGVFQRAMRLVPENEARSLWAEFDAQVERLCAIEPASED